MDVRVEGKGSGTGEGVSGGSTPATRLHPLGDVPGAWYPEQRSARRVARAAPARRWIRRDRGCRVGTGTSCYPACAGARAARPRIHTETRSPSRRVGQALPGIGRERSVRLLGPRGLPRSECARARVAGRPSRARAPFVLRSSSPQVPSGRRRPGPAHWPHPELGWLEELASGDWARVVASPRPRPGRAGPSGLALSCSDSRKMRTWPGPTGDLRGSVASKPSRGVEVARAPASA